MNPTSFYDAEAPGKVRLASGAYPLPVDATNISNKDRDNFERYSPSSSGGTVWNEVKGAGDIIMADGNTAGASYLVISKDPLSESTESKITTIAEYHMPMDLAVGLSRSYAALGVEFAVEVVDSDVLSTPDNLTATSIQQTTTVLSVTTSTEHGLVVGKRISVSGCSDSRLNYPSLVVATVPTSTTFTCTAGPGGTIPSQSVGPVTGTISFRYSLGLATNGTSMIFENATATNASFYIRSEAGDALPSGAIAGNHSITTGSTAPIALVNAANSYAWSPTTEFNLSQQIDRLQWMDGGVDATTQKNNRVNRTQVVPSHLAKYRLRFRATNNKSLSIPVAKIVSITKSGSTTWTVITDAAHGLTVSDFINIYGNRDTVNFPNLTTATVVNSIIDATTFTVISGTGTAVGFGGTVYRVQGGNLPSALGVISMVVQTVSRTSNIVTAVCSASVTGVSIGDYINLHGCRESAAGADIGLDGPYKIRDIATTTLTLEPIGTAPTGVDVVSTNCGGAIIKRCDLRISYRRAWDYERLRVEALARPTADIASAFPVVLQGGTTAVTSTNLSTNIAQIGGNTVTTAGVNGVLAVGGTAAAGSAASGQPVQVGIVAATAIQTARTAGQIVIPASDKIGRTVSASQQIRDLNTMAPMVTLTSTTETTVVAAVASIFNDAKAFLITNTSATASRVDFRDTIGGTVRFSVMAEAGRSFLFAVPETVAKQSTVNTNWTAQLGTAVTDVRITGFVIQVN